jgi:hypothetical protein
MASNMVTNIDLGADPESRGNLDSSPTFGVYEA